MKLDKLGERIAKTVIESAVRTLVREPCLLSDSARVDSQLRTMDQAYGGTGSSRYYIATAFQDVRTYVVLRLLLMGGNGSTPVGQG